MAEKFSYASKSGFIRRAGGFIFSRLLWILSSRRPTQIKGGTAVEGSKAEYNTVIIGPNVGTNGVMKLYGIYGGNVDIEETSNYENTFVGNTLHAHSRIETQVLNGFQNYVFYLPEDDTLLTTPRIKVTDKTTPVLFVTDLNKEHSKVVLVGSPLNLKASDTLTLISTAAGFADENGTKLPAGDLPPIQTSLSLLSQYSLVRQVRQDIDPSTYKLQITENGDGQDLVVKSASNGGDTPTPPVGPENPTTEILSPELYALSQASLSGYGTLFAASDLFIDTLMHSREARRTGLFAAARSGRYSIGDSPKLKTTVTSALIGMSGEITQSTELGGFVEIGYADYDVKTNLSGQTVKNSGTNNFVGLGVYANQTIGDTGMKLTGYLKAGAFRNDYDAVIDNQTRSLAKTSAYWGAHLGLNYSFDVTQALSSRVFLNYYYDGMDGQSHRLNGSLNESVHYDALNGHRAQIGTRLEYAYEPNLKPFVSVALEHVFAAEAEGTAKDDRGELPLRPADMEGSTGVLSLGWTYLNEAKTFEFGLAVNGYAGTRKGINAELNGIWRF